MKDDELYTYDGFSRIDETDKYERFVASLDYIYDDWGTCADEDDRL